MQATFNIAVIRKYSEMERRITYSYGIPGSFNPAVTTNKEAHIMIYGNMNNETGSSQAASFHKKTSRKFLPSSSACCVGHEKCVGQTEALTPFTSREKKRILVDTIKNLHQC